MKDKRRALSLLEVVIAIVILGLAVPPIMCELIAGARQRGEAAIQANLNRLASERMWQIFTDHADAARGYAYVTQAAYPAEAAPGGLTGYSRVTQIREVSPANFMSAQAGSGIKRFLIEVTSPGGRRQRIESFVAQ